MDKRISSKKRHNKLLSIVDSLKIKELKRRSVMILIEHERFILFDGSTGENLY